MRIWLGCIAAISLLAACDAPQSADYAASPPVEDRMLARQDGETISVTGSRISRDGGTAASPVQPSEDAVRSAGGEVEAPAGVMLAYSHSAQLELPAASVRSAVEAHEAACRAAGPSRCLVLGVTVNSQGEAWLTGSLSLRAAPDWLEGFRAGLESDAQDAGGRLVSVSSSAEDLTRSITDTQARLNAQETLRDRLVDLLSRETGRVGDLLEIERELARVQGGIDSARAQLAVMRTRVAMSTMDLSYTTRRQAVTRSDLNPIERALTGFTGIAAESVAAVILFVAAVLPFAVILVPLAWLALWLLGRRRRLRAEKAAAKAEAEA